jgi:hypothetical protein
MRAVAHKCDFIAQATSQHRPRASHFQGFIKLRSQTRLHCSGHKTAQATYQSFSGVHCASQTRQTFLGQASAGLRLGIVWMAHSLAAGLAMSRSQLQAIPVDRVPLASLQVVRSTEALTGWAAASR